MYWNIFTIYCEGKSFHSVTLISQVFQNYLMVCLNIVEVSQKWPNHQKINAILVFCKDLPAYRKEKNSSLGVPYIN